MKLLVDSWSRYARRQFTAHPEWVAQIEAVSTAALTPAVLDAHLSTFKGAGWRDFAHLQAGLRRMRNFWLLAIAERDLGGRADLAEVTAAMTALADRAIAEALVFLSAQLASRHGVPIGARGPQDLVVVAMGKMGAGELNVSSDVDLVFLYEEEGETAVQAEGQRSLSVSEFMARLARRLMQALGEVTQDGFVFRVDMRLRPNGDSGPLVASLAMLEEYLVVQGRAWERLAWIKARVVDAPALGTSVAAVAHDLEALVRPFVFRRYLDFSAIAALRDLHTQIRAEAARRALKAGHAGVNIKLGRGGIREIEFIAQHFQLIRGGREPSLRARPTLVVLDRLAEQGHLRASVVRQLKRTYQLLREVEHRLQYRDDAQTHVLPIEPAELADLAAMCAHLPEPPADATALLERLAREQSFVAAQFDALFRTGREQAASAVLPGLWTALSFADDSRGAAEDALAQAGFADVAGAYGQLHALWHSARIRALSAAARDRLEKLVPAALALAVRHAREQCDATVLLGRLLGFVEAIAGRASYLALLYEFPQAFARVADILAASPWAARFLTLHPLLLDELLDEDTAGLPALAEVRRQLERDMLAAAGDVERQLDVLREAFHARSFALLVEDLSGRLSVESLADHLSALADLIIACALHWAWSSLSKDAAAPPDFAVIAYGKLGGKELGYASDLDLVFLTGVSAESEAIVPYGRLAQRLISWLTARTPAGGLFEIDVRLRPDGAAGLNVATLQGFIQYQEKDAWVWEHQALTRARFVAGHAGLGEAFEATRRAILARPRELSTLAAEIVAMRERMHAGHPNPSGLFDLKHDRGGMVDIEFCVQFLVLGYTASHPELAENVGNIALLRRAASAGLIPATLAAQVADAYREFRRVQHTLRLAEVRFARVEPERFAVERRAVETLYHHLLR